MQPFIALTDDRWFRFLGAQAGVGVVDEVNFWSPSSDHPLKNMAPGEPVFFRLKSPINAIAGYGFFAHFRVVQLHDVWELFDWKNGYPDRARFLQAIGDYRKIDMLTTSSWKPLGCTVLRQARFWAPERWIPWGENEGWQRNIVRGKTEDDPNRAAVLLNAIANDGVVAPEEFADAFVPVDVDDRRVVLANTIQREGQGSFRVRLLDAYDGRCAITGEHTEPVLDAAHIQPYRGPRSNHLQNGLLLTKEFHTLFDRGYVTVTPEHEVRISTRLRHDWNNGKRYYAYDAKPLVQLPSSPRARPSAEALEWHAKHVFLG